MGIRLSNALRMGVVGEKVYLPEPFGDVLTIYMIGKVSG